MSRPTFHELSVGDHVLRAVLQGGGVGFILTEVPSAFGVPISVGAGVAIGAATAAAARLVRALREPVPEIRTAALSRLSDEPGQPFARAVDIELRLDWGRREAARYDAVCRPMLERLARERLLRKHGVSVELQPETARAVLGEDLWQHLYEPREAAGPGPGPTPSQTSRVVAAIEAL